MASWQTPVTSTAASYYSYSDWNRVENNVVYLVSLLQTCGIIIPALTTVTNRADGSYMDFYDSLNRIESNILAIFLGYHIAPVGWITPKTNWSYNQPISYLDTNRIEGNEQGLYNMLSGVIQEFPICGQSLNICGLGWRN